MKKILALLLVFHVSFLVLAQRNFDYELKAGGKIQALVQNNLTGILVIQVGSSLQGFNPDTKQVVWRLNKEDLGKASFKDYLNDPELGSLFKERPSLVTVQNSPYVEAFIDSKYLIINTETGVVVYNSSNEPFMVFQSEFLPETDEYLLTLKNGDSILIALLDMKTGKLKWSSDVGKAKSLLGSLFASKAELTNIARINGKTIYYLLYEKLYSLEKETGKFNWVSQEEYTSFFPTQNDKNVVVINSKGILSSKEYLNVLNTSTGKSIWEESIKTKKVVYLEDWGDKLLVAHYSGFNFFDLNTGAKIWKKDARGEGLKRVIPIDKDFLYVAENEMMLINKNGEKLWKNFIEIADEKEDPIYYLGKVGSKVMYLTGTYGNMVDYVSGRKLWKRNIKFNEKRPVLPSYDEKANAYLVYNDEKLYKFNPSIDDKPEPFAEVNIKNEKELNDISLFPWGVTLTGPVEIMGVGLDGKVKYHRFYKQPGEGTRQVIKGAAIAGKLAFGANALKATLEGAEIKMYYRDETGEMNTVVLREEDKAKMAEATVSAAASTVLNKIQGKFASRFNAMKQNSEYAFIYAKDDSGAKVLVKIRKTDGEEVDKLTFKNDRPLYEIDAATQNVYYVLENSLLVFEAKK